MGVRKTRTLIQLSRALWYMNWRTFLALAVWSVLPLPYALRLVPCMILFVRIGILVPLEWTARLSLWTTIKAACGMGFLVVRVVTVGTTALDRMVKFRPQAGFRPVATAPIGPVTAEHRSRAQRGLYRYEYGGSDGDGDGYGGSAERVLRNETGPSRQGREFAGVRFLRVGGAVDE